MPCGLLGVVTSEADGAATAGAGTWCAPNCTRPVWPWPANRQAPMLVPVATTRAVPQAAMRRWCRDAHLYEPLNVATVLLLSCVASGSLCPLPFDRLIFRSWRRAAFLSAGDCCGASFGACRGGTRQNW